MQLVDLLRELNDIVTEIEIWSADHNDISLDDIQKNKRDKKKDFT